MAPDTVLFAMPSDSNSDAEDSMDTDEDEESEVEFWGGESPRSRHASPSQAHEMVIDGSSEDEDDDDSEDEEMSDEAEDDEADEYNRMEIFGHR